MIRNRVKEMRLVRAGDLIPNPQNWRSHPERQRRAVEGILHEVGYVDALKARECEDGSLMLLDGHLRAEIDPDLMVPVLIVELTDAEAKLVLATFDPLGAMAETDQEELDALLAQVETDNEALQGMLADLRDDDATLDELAKGEIEQDKAPEAPRPGEARTQPGDLWILGGHRLLCGDSTNRADVERLLEDRRPFLMVTDPPYGVEYDAEWRRDAGLQEGGAYGKVTNDDRADWSPAWALFPGDVAYVWHAGVVSPAVGDSLVSEDFQLRNLIIWAKDRLVIGRGNYHHQHEPCQPEGTMVSRVIKGGRWKEHSTIEEVPIETLQVGDKVVSFGSSKIRRRGRMITEIGSRNYTGNMHTVSVGERSTKATAEHQFTTRFDPELGGNAVLYLMRRGDWWRIGVCRMFNSRGFGLAVRLQQESGDEAWILSAHDDLRSARIAEQVASCSYGIPTTHWETDRGPTNTKTRDKCDIAAIYEGIGVEEIEAGAIRLLHDNGRRLAFPFIKVGDEGVFSRHKTRIVRACNLIPRIMQLPVPKTYEDFEWVPITSNGFEAVSDVKVWSMNVDEEQHYVADGIVTHNCWYAVRRGATAKFTEDRTQTTLFRDIDDVTDGQLVFLAKDKAKKVYAIRGDKSVLWQIPKPTKSETGHSTQKPVECMARPIRNHGGPNDDVYDPFAGSGTTIIAAEQLGRRCYAMELEPAYCDVIVTRWENLTGRRAELVRSAEAATTATASEE